MKSKQILTEKSKQTPKSTPKLIIITGVPCSGKSSVSREILKNFKAMYIDKDMINDGFTLERESQFYQKIREGTYKAIDNIAGENLLYGNNVLIDGTFSTEIQNKKWFDRYAKLAKDTRSDLRLIRCIAPQELIKRRLKQRGFDKDKPKLKAFDEFLDREPIIVKWIGQLEIDTSKDFKKNIKDILKFIN